MRILALCAISACLFLAGCNLVGSSKPEVTLNEACDADKQFCEKIQADSRCRNKRKTMIIARHKLMQSRDKNLAFDSLLATEDFVKCAELATLIQYKSVEDKFGERDKNRTTPLSKEEIRVRKEYKKSVSKRSNQKQNNYRHAVAELKKLEEWTHFSKIPELAYYQWSRHNDNTALQRLINADKEGKIDKAWLHYEVSKHYSKVSDEKAIESLNRSLILLEPEKYSPKPKIIDQKKKTHDDMGMFYFEAFRSLASIHFSRGELSPAYVFAQMLEINNDNTADLDFITQYIEKHSRHKIPKLVELADDLHEKMEDGELTEKFLSEISQYKL